MGIRPYKAFTFDGTSSSDFGVYLTGEGVFNAPVRSVEMISIAGRNGEYALDLGRFENINVTYKAGMVDYSETDFAQRLSDFRNFLCSKVGYCRLEDDYNTNEYRMAVYSSGVEVEHVDLITGQFDITFNCKPQRYLAIGEEVITIGAWGNTETVEGDIVTIEASSDTSVKALTADIDPLQDLHGYDAPWVGGAGKNKLRYPYVATSGSSNGITWTINSNGTVTLGGTASAEVKINFNALADPIVIGSGTHRVVTSAGASYNPQISGLNFQTDIYKDGTYIGTVQNGNAGVTVSSATEISIGLSRLLISSGTVIPNNTVFYPQIEFGDTTPTSWTPYENICPISGHDDVTVTVADDVDNPTVSEDYTTTLPSTTYGGTLDVVSGTLRPAPYYASYNSEALEGEWISDRDEYIPNTTPTIGAQVVNIGKVGTATQLTGQTVDLLEGENNIFADSGNVTVEYGHDPTVLTNPTLFDSSPLLEVKGYGNIDFNGYRIALANAVFGDVTQMVNESNWYTLSTTFEDAMFNIGDTITVDMNYFNYGAYIILSSTTTPTTSGTVTDSDPHFTTVVTDCANEQGISPAPIFVHIKTTCTPITFTIGTADTVTNTAEVVVNTQGDKCKWQQTVKYTIEGNGNHKITIKQSLVGATGTNVITATTLNAYPMMLSNSVVGHSTLSVLGDPTYIDCDIGEAYLINDGTAVSLNSYIDLGSELPTLASGDNTVTTDNTVTELKVKPRYWKV